MADLKEIKVDEVVSSSSNADESAKVKKVNSLEQLSKKFGFKVEEVAVNKGIFTIKSNESIKTIESTESELIEKVEKVEEPKTYASVLKTPKNDENELVTLDELTAVEEEVPKSKWDDPEVIKSVQKEVKALCNVRFKRNVMSENVLKQGLKLILGDLWTDYRSFKRLTTAIATGRERRLFCSRLTNKETYRYDYWIVRNFVLLKLDDIDLTITDESTGAEFTKKQVLTSRDFNQFMKVYCKNDLQDEAHYSSFSGNLLDLSKFEKDLSKLPDPNPHNLILVQFKMKNPEIVIGRTGSSASMSSGYRYSTSVQSRYSGFAGSVATDVTGFTSPGFTSPSGFSDLASPEVRVFAKTARGFDKSDQKKSKGLKNVNSGSSWADEDVEDVQVIESVNGRSEQLATAEEISEVQ